MRKWVFMLVFLALSCAFGVFALNSDERNTPDEMAQRSEPDELGSYVVLIEDIDHEQVLSAFASRYPEEYQLYITIKNSETIPDPEEYDSELLNNAIAHKRSIYREYYGEANELFMSDYLDQVTCLFISHYSPLVLIECSPQELLEIQKDERVVRITEYQQDVFSVDGLSNANAFTRADYVRDTCGNAGSGVKIGMVELYGVPNLSHSSLSQANIIVRIGCNYSDSYQWMEHATEVASIMVGTSVNSNADGFAPSATLYCSRVTAMNPVHNLFDSIEWLLDNDVNIINASIDAGEEGLYGTVCRWVDHIAVQHDVHFVTSAGNIEPNESNLITAPGLAYNAITVGAFDPQGATQWESYDSFLVWQNERYEENDTSYPEKPNLLADGIGFMGMSGTSFSSPQAAGVIAQLCSYNSALKIKQSTVGAILMASAARKINTGGSKTVGSSFVYGDRISYEPQISELEGAGLLDARWARDVVSSGNYWGLTIYENSFPYSKYVS